jgi:transketolase C-terminal domain/subunit
VLEPADARDLYNAFSDTMTKNHGFTYVRLHRGDVQILDRDPADMRNTDAYAVHRPDKISRLVIAASGFVVGAAIDAARLLEAEEGLPTTVINVVNQKSLHYSLPTLLANDAPILTVYNGNPHTLQANVSSAILSNADAPRPKFIAGHGFMGGTSGRVKELIRYYKLDADGIRDVALRSLAA